MLTTNKEILQSTINCNECVIIDFNAAWCGPCKTIKPILEEIDAKFDNITVFSVDIEEGDDIVDEFQIQSIPTLVYFKNGVQIDKTVGALSMDTILSKFHESNS